MGSISMLAVLPLGAMIAWGIGDFLIQRSTRKIGDLESITWIGIIGSIGLLPFVARDLTLLAVGSNFSFLFALGLAVFVVALINFEALKQGKLSVIDVILEIELPVTAVLGIIFLRESISFGQGILIAVILSGVVLMAIKPANELRPKKRSRFFEKGIWLALAAAVGVAGTNLLTAISAKNISPLLAIWMPWTVVALIGVGYLIFQKRFRVFLGHIRTAGSLILTMSIFDTLAWALYALALRGNTLSLTTAMTESYPAIALMLGVWLNKERVVAHQYIGAALAIGASIVIGILT